MEVQLKASKIGKTEINSETTPYRFEGIRLDCYPNNKCTSIESKQRNDCPFYDQSVVGLDGKPIKMTKSPAEKKHTVSVPYIGTVSQEEKKTNKFYRK